MIDLEAKDYELDISDNEDDMNKKIDRLMEMAKKLHDEKVREWDANMDAFDGKSMTVEEREQYQSDTELNYIFWGCRSYVGLMTDSRPTAIIKPAPSSDDAQFRENSDRARKAQWMVEQRWSDIDMYNVIVKLFFQLIIYQDTYLEPYWDYEEDDIGTRVVQPHDIYIHPMVKRLEDSPWVIKKSEQTINWIKDNYPDKYKKIQLEEEKYSSPDAIEIQEIYTKELKIIRVPDAKLILEKGDNPYYEFKSEDEQMEELIEEMGGIEEGEDVDFEPIVNFFSKPRYPFIKFDAYNTGKSLYSHNLIKQLEKIQKSLSKRKRQIDDNCNLGANPRMVYNKNYISPEEANIISNAPQEKIPIDPPEGVKISEAIDFQSGTHLPQYVIDDMIHSQRAFDDGFGLHDVSRGGRITADSATEASILKDADQVVVRLLVRNAEPGLKKLIEFWLQLMSLFYTEEKYIKKLGREGGYEYISFTRSDIDDGMEVLVEPGSTLPTDKVSMRRDAKELFIQGKIDPLTFAEYMDYPDPEKFAARYANWVQSGVISDQMPTGGSQASDADWENKEMSMEREQVVKREDNHDLHIQVHQAYPQLNLMHLDHIKKHKEMTKPMQQPNPGTSMTNPGNPGMASPGNMPPR